MMTLRSFLLVCLGTAAVAHIDHPKYRRAKQKVDHEYIIICNNDVRDPHALARSLVPKGAVINFYEKVVHGFSVRLSEEELEPILNHEGVESVEEVSSLSRCASTIQQRRLIGSHSSSC